MEGRLDPTTLKVFAEKTLNMQHTDLWSTILPLQANEEHLDRLCEEALVYWKLGNEHERHFWLQRQVCA